MAVAISVPMLILMATLIYGMIGVVFSALFVFRGAAVIDPIVRTTPLRTRVLFAPGAVAVWPVLLIKWLSARRAG